MNKTPLLNVDETGLAIAAFADMLMDNLEAHNAEYKESDYISKEYISINGIHNGKKYMIYSASDNCIPVLFIRETMTDKVISGQVDFSVIEHLARHIKRYNANYVYYKIKGIKDPDSIIDNLFNDIKK